MPKVDLTQWMAVALLCAGLAPLRAADAAQDVEAVEAAGVTGTAGALVEAEAYTVTGRRENSLELKKASQAGSRLEIPLIELPASADIISARTISERGYSTAQEAVQSSPGLILYTEKTANPIFVSRGFFRDNVVVTRDGLRQDSQIETSRPLDPFNLERVEVLKGPASLMQGLNAVGGVINYVGMKPLAEGRQTELLLSYGRFGRSRAGLAYHDGFGLAGQAWRYRLGLVNARQERGYHDRTRYDNYDVALDLQGAPASGLVLALKLSYLSTDINGHNGIPSVNNRHKPVLAEVPLTNNYDVTDGFSHSRDLRAVLEAGYQVSEAVRLRNTAFAMGIGQEERFTDTYDTSFSLLTLTANVRNLRRNDGQVGNRSEAVGTWELGFVRSRTLAALELRQDNIERRDGGSFAISNISLANPGVITAAAGNYSNPARRSVSVDKTTAALEESLSFFERVHVLGGLSWDQVDIRYFASNALPHLRKSYQGVLSGRLGVLGTVYPGVNLYGSYTDASTPFFGGNGGLVNVQVAQVSFDLEKARQWEAGAKAELWDGRLALTSAVYLIEKTDIVAFSETFPGSGVYVQGNVGKQSSRGGELSAAVKPWGGLVLEGNLAITRARFDDYRSGATVNRTGNTPSFIPDLSSLFVARYEFESGLGLGYGHRFVGDRYADFDNRGIMPAYHMVDLDLSYRRAEQSYSIRMKNVTDQKAVLAARTVGSFVNDFKVAEPQSLEAVFNSKF
jgi:iron complex outermembrane recepter protein